MSDYKMNKKDCIKLVKKYLRQVTSSNNYCVEDEEYRISICFKTKKYLTWLDKDHNRDYTYIAWCNYNHTQSLNELIHTLIVCDKVKSLKEKNMPLNIFIKEVFSWCEMCCSLLAYDSTGEEYFTNRQTYKLPESTKREIYNYMKSVKENVDVNVYEDSEGVTYNSIYFTNVLTAI